MVFTGDMPKKLRLGTYRKRRSERIPYSYVVSLPLTLFTAAPLCNAQRLDQRIKATGGPPHGKLLHPSDYKCMCINPEPVCLNRLDPDILREFPPLHQVGFVPICAPVALLPLNL